MLMARMLCSDPLCAEEVEILVEEVDGGGFEGFGLVRELRGAFPTTHVGPIKRRRASANGTRVTIASP
jgi:hypothetical protein